MDFYSSTENDPLQKFLFPNETEALRGNNLLMMVGWGEGRIILVGEANILSISFTAFCPDEMRTTLDKILHREHLSIHRKASLNFFASKTISSA